MLALKKKREAEKKAQQEQAATGGGANAAQEPAKVSLLGVGGKKTVKNDDGESSGKKRSPGEIRIQKDIAELDGGKVATVDFPNANDLTAFNVSISPDSGYWQGATYLFSFVIPPHYPHSPPKVECHTKIYHPNIDLQGKVCLNILREDWKPVLDINAVIYGLIYLFYEPNPDDPLNHEAAELFRKDVRQFERLVTRTLRGGILDGVQFERLV
mmetsp:Transcript_17567/g.47885  ORF Transcript_17567/g.47885 Transcript_17567/m.47885 type:complete len:213 (+) Transcript_17567:72-710(+)